MTGEFVHRRRPAVLLLLLLAACGTSGTPQTVTRPRPAPYHPRPTASPTMSPSPSPSTQPPNATCTAPAADPHVYHPDRLTFLGCATAEGTVDVIRSEPDGDNHILLKLDPAYTGLLVPANQGAERGDLVLEQPCDHTVTQTDAIAGCKIGGEPRFTFTAGHRYRVSGAYVADTDHGGWHELHPLTSVTPIP